MPTSTNIFQKGFTLLEISIYLAIVAILFSVSIPIFSDLILAQQTTDLKTDTDHQLFLTTKRLEYELSQAIQILEVTPTSICIQTHTQNQSPWKLSLLNNSLQVEWGSDGTDCDNLTVQGNLTSPTVKVDGFTLTPFENEHQKISGIEYQISLTSSQNPKISSTLQNYFTLRTSQ